MPDSPVAFPYVTHLNVLCGPLERIDVQTLVDRCTDRWYNQTLCRVNGSVVRLGIVQPRQGFVVPKGTLHRPRAPERTVVLMVEGAGIVPTGDS